jgi:amino acid adenylation domain-containing protein
VTTGLLQEWVTRQAETRPDAVAVVMGGERLTYGQLEILSNQLAHALQAAGCQRGDRVGLLLRKSPTMVACMLGALKADACHVPLDLASPAPRLAKIVESAEPGVILVAENGAGTLRALLSTIRRPRTPQIAWMAPKPDAGANVPRAPVFTLDDVRRMPTRGRSYQNTAGDCAHILFTSGSTGVPKGVIITHANVIRFVSWAVDYFGLSASDRTSGHSPCHFDLSTFDLFGTFAAGAQIHLVPPELNVVPHKLAAFMRESQLTQWFSVPSILTLMAQLDVVQTDDFPALRRLLWCGEVFPTRALRYWMSRLPHVTFTNLYGPTEATIASSYYTVPRCPAGDTEPIPIGSPCAGEKLLVLDHAFRPVPEGEIGDLFIQGVGLSPGYWRDPAKTRSAFLPHPADSRDRIYRTGDLARVGPDGLVYFVGRADSQIKSRGYRVELGEIEAALQTLPQLQEGAIIALPTDRFEGTLICCAYVARPGAAVTAISLRQQLAALLPSYMVPSEWKACDALPRNANGKIDRRRIQEEWKRDETAPAGRT